jgi:hypothetical protein
VQLTIEKPLAACTCAALLITIVVVIPRIPHSGKILTVDFSTGSDSLSSESQHSEVEVIAALEAMAVTLLVIDNPTECSGPPHLLGPWGSAGAGAVRVASS